MLDVCCSGTSPISVLVIPCFFYFLFMEQNLLIWCAFGIYLIHKSVYCVAALWRVSVPRSHLTVNRGGVFTCGEWLRGHCQCCPVKYIYSLVDLWDVFSHVSWLSEIISVGYSSSYGHLGIFFICSVMSLNNTSLLFCSELISIICGRQRTF